METTVYLQERQLQDLLQISNFFHRGVGFHWEHEGVVHAFTHFPDIAPSGKPLLVLYKNLAADESIEDCLDHLPGIELDLNTIQNAPVSRFLCLFFQFGESRAFLKNDGEFTECLIKTIPSVEPRQAASPWAIFRNKKVVVVGLGALGLRICMELADAGIGHFLLFDFDRLDHLNVHYHLGGRKDIGRLKTATAREIILSRDHKATVRSFEVDVTEEGDLLEQECLHADIILCATANHLSRLHINALALSLKKTTIFVRMLREHTGGEIFRFRTASPNAPCFGCILCTGRLFQEPQEDLRLSDTPDRQSDTSFQFELAPVASLAAQMILHELLPDNSVSFHDYSFWANREAEYLSMVWELWKYKYPDDHSPQTLRWLGFDLAKVMNCPVCGYSGV